MSKFGKLIKKRRKELGLSVRDVAKATGATNVSRYERAIVEPAFSTAVKLAKFYKMDVRVLAEVV